MWVYGNFHGEKVRGDDTMCPFVSGCDSVEQACMVLVQVHVLHVHVPVHVLYMYMNTVIVMYICTSIHHVYTSRCTEISFLLNDAINVQVHTLYIQYMYSTL